ncbi:MAG: hypothetical protein J6W54_04235 [Fibrobacter sp.]|uniref:hypothetical protein n=1 Tax=Fibrobacter sp. TaxID=35828 RepID=UPI001B19F95E|nr:hypothetical protein [Fibrobacter sp.]MBO7060289.1 hypothetical protein [Fibrobacter sp.]
MKEYLFCECDEIVREYRGQLSNEMRPYYLKSEADKAIADKDKEIAELKADYSAEVEELCIEKTNVDTLEQAWKKSQRALWLMRAYFCGRSSEYFSGMASRCKIGQEDFYKEVSEKARRYLKASYKCQAMVKKLR